MAGPALYTGSPVLSDNGDGTFHVQMGPWGFDYSKQRIIDLGNGLEKNPDMLIGAFLDDILRNNVTLTFPAMATWLQSRVFKW